MTERGDQRKALERALKSVEVADLDAAGVGLARRYADLIDNASPAAKYRKALAILGKAIPLSVADDVDAEDLYRAWDVVTDALAQHSVASDLGPKYLATLTSLGLTPAGRGEKGKTRNDRTGDQAKLDELRQRRVDRARRAPDLHASAP